MSNPRVADFTARRRARVKKAEADAQWPLDDAITVVLFAGLGGACQGLEEAGLPVHIAVNHDAVAIAAHRALNPHTTHMQGDIFDIDPVRAVGGRRVKDLWASPDCRDHSVAKGGAPRSPRVRSMPWQVLRWAAKTRPDRIYVENVREIRGWGPLRAKRDPATGRVLKLDKTVAAPGERVPIEQQMLVRDRARLGKHFRRWVAGLRSLGYDYDDRDLCCADYGVPTSRKRFFAVARRDGLPICWPVQTHAQRQKAAEMGLQPWVAAATIINWNLKLPSIFERKKPLAEATLKRIAKGLMRYVINCPEPFIVSVANTGSTGRGAYTWPASEPTRTQPTTGTFGLAGPSLSPVTHTGDRTPQDAATDPMATITTAQRGEMALSAATVVPAEEFAAGIVGAGGRAAQMQPMDLRDPANTSTTKEDRALFGASLTKFNENSIGQAPGEPLDTLLAGAPRFGVLGAELTEADALAPTIVRPGHTGEGYTAHRGHDAADPLQSQTQSPEFSVVAASLTKFRPGATGADLSDSLPALTANGHSPTRPGCAIPLGIVGATLVQTGYGEREGQEPRALDIEEPIGTQVAGAAKHGLVGAFMARYHGERRPDETRGAATDEPVPAQTTENRFGLVGATLVEHRGGSIGQAVEDPLGAQTQVPHHAVVGAWLPQNNTGVVGHPPTDPLSTSVTAVGPQSVAGAYLTKLRGTSSAANARDATPTVSAQGNHIGAVAAFLTKYYSSGSQDQDARDPFGTLSTADRFGVVTVTIGGTHYIITDIGMRMLEPEEAASAHELRLPDTIEIDGKRRPLTKTEKMRLVGNSVPKRMAKLIAEANAVHAITGRAGARA